MKVEWPGLDGLEKTIEVYREPHLSGYGYPRVFRAGQAVSAVPFADIMIDVAELLKTSK